MKEVPTVKLNTGDSMPAIGFGTWKINDQNDTKNAVIAALQTGYRLIDTAKIYGNEEPISYPLAINRKKGRIMESAAKNSQTGFG
jgi:diketogulonate reductase-like aldo/keto reductase